MPDPEARTPQAPASTHMAKLRRTADQWPPKDVQYTSLYLRPRHRLSAEPELIGAEYADRSMVMNRTLSEANVELTVIEGGKGTVHLEAGPVLHLVWNSGVRIEAADALAAMAAVNLVADGSAYPLLVDMAATEYISRQARTVFAAPCAASRIALLGASPVDRMIVDFQLGSQKPPCPTRFFTSRAEATTWLHEASAPLA